MIAYFVYSAREDRDLIVIPDSGCTVEVDGGVMERFIAPEPDFAGMTGEPCASAEPEDFGKVVASREDGGDVCILDAAMWQRRMTHHLGRP